jgi:cytochrome b561
MQPIDHDAIRYDTKTIIFHWVTVVLVATQWLGAQTIDWFPSGALRVDARSMHIAVGVLLAGILLARIVWRLTGGRRLPSVGEGVIPLIAKVTHWGLYGLLAAMVIVGMVLTWTRGDSIFNLFAIPSYDPGNRALSDQIQEIHAVIGWMIVGLAGVHASAALIHRYFWDDGVLGRMLTGRPHSS